MKKFDKAIFTGLIFSTLIFLSCGKLVSDSASKNDEEVEVTFSFNVNELNGNDSNSAASRTIFPESPDIYRYEISYAKYDHDDNLGEFSDFFTVYESTWGSYSISLRTGKYDFICNAYDYSLNKMLSGKSTEEVNANSNWITLSLDYFKEGEGTVYLSCYGIDSGFAKVFLNEEDITSSVTEWAYDESEGYAFFMDNSWFYINQRISSGDHELIVEFYDSSKNLMRRRFEIVKVRDNITSSANIYYYE